MPYSEEIVLPGNTQAFIDAPIYARTNGYLKRWYFDRGAAPLHAFASASSAWPCCC
jgi:hypothetical protein